MCPPRPALHTRNERPILQQITDCCYFAWNHSEYFCKFLSFPASVGTSLQTWSCYISYPLIYLCLSYFFPLICRILYVLFILRYAGHSRMGKTHVCTKANSFVTSVMQRLIFRGFAACDNQRSKRSSWWIFNPERELTLMSCTKPHFIQTNNGTNIDQVVAQIAMPDTMQQSLPQEPSHIGL